MDLASVRAAARRRWRALVLLFLLGIAAAMAWWAVTPVQYRASATVIFALDGGTTVRDVVDGGTYVQQVVPSYAELALTPLVLQGVISELGLGTTPPELAKKISVDVKSRSVLAEISADAGSAQGAADLANAVTTELARAVRSVSQGTQRAALPIVVRTVSVAKVPTSPIAPNTVRQAGFGVFGGLLLAGLYLYLREAVAGTVRTREDVAEVTAVPVVASIVRDPRARTRPLPVDSQPHLPRSESFRMLRTNLLARLAQDTRLVAVVSGQAGEGRTSLAANLAVALANSGRRVLVIDADLRNPQVSSLFSGVNPSLGLTSVLSGAERLDSVIQPWSPRKWDAQPIDVITAGSPAEGASELLGSSSMTGLLDEVSSRYDLVLVDTPALLDSTDGALVAAQTDASIVVVDARTTARHELTEVMHRLEMAASVIGVVLNNTPESGGSSGVRSTAGSADADRADAQPGGRPASRPITAAPRDVPTATEDGSPVATTTGPSTRTSIGAAPRTAARSASGAAAAGHRWPSADPRPAASPAATTEAAVSSHAPSVTGSASSPLSGSTASATTSRLDLADIRRRVDAMRSMTPPGVDEPSGTASTPSGTAGSTAHGSGRTRTAPGDDED